MPKSFESSAFLFISPSSSQLTIVPQFFFYFSFYCLAAMVKGAGSLAGGERTFERFRPCLLSLPLWDRPLAVALKEAVRDLVVGDLAEVMRFGAAPADLLTA